MSEVTEQQLEDMEALFVQTAASMTRPPGARPGRGRGGAFAAELRSRAPKSCG
jgi:hypothetical protein